MALSLVLRLGGLHQQKHANKRVSVSWKDPFIATVPTAVIMYINRVQQNYYCVLDLIFSDRKVLGIIDKPTDTF